MDNEKLLDKLIKAAIDLKRLIHDVFKYDQAREEYKNLRAQILERMEE